MTAAVQLQDDGVDGRIWNESERQAFTAARDALYKLLDLPGFLNPLSEAYFANSEAYLETHGEAALRAIYSACCDPHVAHGAVVFLFAMRITREDSVEIRRQKASILYALVVGGCSLTVRRSALTHLHGAPNVRLLLQAALTLEPSDSAFSEDIKYKMREVRGSTLRQTRKWCGVG